MTNDTHCIRRSNNNIKVQIACFDFSSQIFETDDIRTSLFSSFCIYTLSKYSHTGCLTSTFRQND
ncbi:Uncharacterised protein [Neisseria gonorrhoeae]|uniref:Uncharacterized protein n=1 Tax=Neisseria gonorrhoeae TaxID=485 RepID=A0A379B0C9_NEIGO|nr:Uncharacterised protein [Neisseria gonorrhoeae]